MGTCDAYGADGFHGKSTFAGSEAHISGTITVTRTWSGPAGTAPLVSYIKKTASVTATAVAAIGGGPGGDDDGGGGGSTPVGTVSASDGLNDTETAGVGTETSQGKHLIRVDSSSGTITESVTVSASANSAGQPVNCQAGGNSTGDGPGFSCDFDDRAVTISDPTNGKFPAYNQDGSLSFDANGDENFVPLAHVLVDGVMYGDTVYTYDNVETIIDPLYNWQYFATNFVGDWHYKSGFDHEGHAEDVPDVVDPDTWSWTPTESEDYWDYGKCEMPLAMNFAIVDGEPGGGVDPPVEYDVTYSATDNTDGAQATAKYVMLVHDPYEKNYPDHVTRGIENLREAPNASYVRSTQDDSTLTVYAEQGDSWSVGVSTSGVIGDWIAKILGISLDASYTYSYNAGVQTSLQHVPAGYATYLEEYDAYKYHVGKADTWTASGYTGTTPYEVKEPDSPPAGYQAHSPAIYLGDGNGP